ncbi:hypothetical protein [Ramlibacter alkalitolerans]
MKPLAITIGDPAGIGPEIIAKAFAEQALTAGCFVAGDVACMRRGAAAIAGGGPPLPIALIASVPEAAQVPPRCIPVLQVGAPLDPLPAWEVLREGAGRVAAKAVLWAASAAA